jgi:hypothetical protein
VTDARPDCTFCRRAPCVCVQAPCCGGVSFDDEFGDVHRCSSSVGELNYQVGDVAGLRADGFVEPLGQASGYSPFEPGPVRSVALLGPNERMVIFEGRVLVEDDAGLVATAATRELRARR